MAGDSSSNLEIVVTAVDEASGALSQVGDSMQAMADQASAVSASVQDSLDTATGGGVLTIGTEPAIADLQQVDDAFAAMSNQASGTAYDVSKSFDDFMSSSANAAQATGLSQDEIQKQMVTTGQTADEVAAQMMKDNEETGASYSDLTHSMRLMASGVIIGGIGSAIMAPVVGSIDSAAQRASALAEGLNSIQDIINGNKGGNSQNATQIADITAKIANYKAAIAQANASMQQNIGMTAVVEARHQKAAAAIQQANINIAKQEALLEGLTAKQQLGSASAQNISNQFQGMATNLTAIGVPFDTTYTALTGFLNVTGSVQGSLLAMNDAAGLVASGKIPDLQTAINAVTMAWQGMGRSGGLKMAVPDLQDGVAGMDALSQIAQATKGSTTVAFAQLTTQVSALQTNLADLGAAFGKDFVGPLTTVVTMLNKVIEKVTEWAQEHPKLAASILIVVGALGALAVVMGGLLVGLATFGLVIEGLTVTLPIIGVSLLTILGPVALVIGAIVALGVIVTLIVSYHTQILNAIKIAWGAIVAFFETVLGDILTLIKDYVNLWVEAFTVAWQLVETATETVWNLIKTFFTTTLNWTKNLFTTSLDDVSSAWNTAWSNMASFLGNIWGTITNTVKSGVDDIITGINYFIKALDAIHITIPSIAIPGTKISTPSINLGFNIPNLPMLADGGFVTGPTLALIGEGGPEAVIPLSGMGGAGYGGFGGSPIIININGGNYLDSQGATMIGNALARQVIQTLRVRNYQP